MPEATRKFTAPRAAQPAASAIDARILERFIDHQHALAARAGALDPVTATRTVMVSPFVAFIIYTVLDGWRLIVTHERRHIEQALRVIQSPEFPA